MPVVTMNIASDWNANHANLPVIANFIYGAVDDKHSTLIHLNFTYQGESMHVTIPLGEGGETSSFHITAKKGSKFANGKSGGYKYIKNTLSRYYDFKVTAASVQFDETKEIRVPGDKKWKKADVDNATFDQAVVDGVYNFMTQFITYMVGQGHGSIG